MTTTAATAKGEATRQRILDAALAEFAAHGIAGARVDRIVETARSNKAQLYSWFENKDGLFDAVFDSQLDRIVEAAPIDGGDLAGWAVRLYDDYLVDPDVVRLATWYRLERNSRGHLLADHGVRDEHKVEAIRAAQQAGQVRDGDPFDLMALILAMSMAWSPVSNVYASTRDEPAGAHEARRDLLRSAVRAAAAPA